MNDTPRSAAEEAQDPGTSPERLMELTERHPQLHGLLVDNPSCPDVARQWILATNPRVRAAHDQRPTTRPDADPDAEDDDGPPTQAMDRVAAPAPQHRDTASPEDASPEDGASLEDTAQHSATPGASPHDDPDSASAWGLPPVQDEPAAPPSPAASAPPTSTGTVREVRAGRGVVPLGPASSAGAAGSASSAEESDYGYDPTPTRMVPVTPGPEDADGSDDDGAGEQDPPRRRGTWWACAGCLLLALVVAIVAVLGLRAWLSDDSGDSSSSSSASQDPSESESSPSEKTTTTKADKSPAPDDARRMSTIVAPSGNITCKLVGQSVGCSMDERSFGGDAEDCPSGPFSIKVSDDSPSLQCGTSFGDDSAPTLDYGSSATKDDVACSSESSGMTCWNVKSGEGFTLSRSGYQTF